MGRRTKKRVEMAFPVRIWGMDAGGKPFSQYAHTSDVSRDGARLAGVRVLLALGDVIGLQYKQQKARCKVVGVGRPGTAKGDQISLEYLEKDKNLWAADVPQEAVVDEFEPAAKAESRAHERRTCSGGAEVKTHPDAPGQWTVLTDISPSGCYLQTTSALPLKTRVQLVIRAQDLEAFTAAVVRASHPGVGMGLEFVDTSAENRRRLEELYQRLAAEAVASAETTETRRRGAELQERLQKAANELRELEEMIRSEDVDADVLAEFREALGHARHSAWGVQQWLELHAKQGDPFPVISYLNKERVRLVTSMCQHLAKDIPAVQLEVPKEEIAALVRAVEDLFQAWPDATAGKEDETE